MCMTERRKSRFSRFPAMGQRNHWWHFLKKMNSWWYTATEKLRSGILLPEKYRHTGGGYGFCTENRYFGRSERQISGAVYKRGPGKRPFLDGWLERVLNIYSVDENSQLHPYADIPYAYVDLEKEMIYALGRDDDRYYGISFYGYRELREKAEQILGTEKRKRWISHIFSDDFAKCPGH